jgi:arsenate reductase
MYTTIFSPGRKKMDKMRILIVCSGNAARSQMAEGLFRHKAGDKIEVFSAGTRPQGLHRFSVDAMNEIGIDISNQQSKSVDIFRNQVFDWVITVCDSAKESCPVFPGSKTIHWSTPDPDAPDSFARVRDQLAKRIDRFLNEHFHN